MRRIAAAACLAGLALSAAACGGDTTAKAGGGDTTANAGGGDTTASAGGGTGVVSAGGGTRIVVRSSQFGRMLFNANRQAIYVFGRDARNRSNCYGDCARAWPPVYTNGKPRALAGVDKSLLGTTRRRGGRLQVTYAGRPLYYYAHEGPGQVLCHDVNLNGGIWKVVAPNGRPRR